MREPDRCELAGQAHVPFCKGFEGHQGTLAAGNRSNFLFCSGFFSSAAVLPPFGYNRAEYLQPARGRPEQTGAGCPARAGSRRYQGMATLMENNSSDTVTLIERARAGDREALGLLLGRHRDRLRRMIDMRLDMRLQARAGDAPVLIRPSTTMSRGRRTTRGRRQSSFQDIDHGGCRNDPRHPEPRRREQIAILRRRPLQTARNHEHIQVHEFPKRRAGVGRDDALDHEQASSGGHDAMDVPQDGGRPLVVPVVKDVPQQVGVRPARH